MKVRAWVAIGLAVLAFGLGFVPVDWMEQVAGFLWLAAIVLGISVLPFWSKAIPELSPMEGLFRKLGEGERWCVLCGTPAPKKAECGVCGGPPKLKQPKAKKAKVAKKAQ